MKQKQILIITAPAIAMMGLTACSDNDNTATRLPADIEASYETLTSTAEKTSTLAGVAIRFSEDDKGTLVDPNDDDTFDNNLDDTFGTDLVRQTGSLTHNTGDITISDDSVTDQSIEFITDGSGDFSGSYDYVAAYEVEYTSDGVNYSSFGVGGIVTRDGDVPTSGAATYTGEADAFVTTFGDDGFDDTTTTLTEGNSVVEADFGAGTVDVTMNGFTAMEEFFNPDSSEFEMRPTTTSPIDTIEITGMMIAGNAFSGGDLTTTLAGAPAFVTGDNTTLKASGNFFGYDGTNAIPDETAGGVLIQGDSGVVAAGFIAD